jgi:hypothetical protein
LSSQLKRSVALIVPVRNARASGVVLLTEMNTWEAIWQPEASDGESADRAKCGYEVAAVMSLLLVPRLVYCLWVLLTPGAVDVFTSNPPALSLIDFVAVGYWLVAGGVACAMLRQRGETAASLGFRADNARPALAFGAVLFCMLASHAITSIGITGTGSIPSAAYALDLLVRASGVVLLMQAYLIPALRRAGASVFWSVAISALLGCIPAISGGLDSVLVAFFTGGVLSVVYAARRSVPELIGAYAAALFVTALEAVR